MASEELKREVQQLERAIRNAIESSEEVQEAVERIRESGFPIALHLMCLFGAPDEIEAEFSVDPNSPFDQVNLGDLDGLNNLGNLGQIMTHFEMTDSVPEFEVTEDDHRFLDDLGITW